MKNAALKKLLNGSFRAPDLGGWHRLSVWGASYQLGFQHGYHLAQEIASALRSSRFWAEWLTAQKFGFFCENVRKSYIDTGLIDPEYLEEMRGIADGVNAAGPPTSFDEIVAYNCFIDLVYNAWQIYRKELKPDVQPARPRLWHGHNCSAFIATGSATSAQQIVMAHNTWAPFLQGQHFNCIIEMVPASGNSIVMQLSPGYIASMTDFVVTSAGLMITETTIDRYSGFTIEKPPAACTSRKAYQYANSIDDWWTAMLEGNNGAYANSWLVGDLKTGEIARGELGLKYQNLERSTAGCFYGENLPSDLSIRNLETADPDAWCDISGSGARRVRWKKLLRKHEGTIDADVAKALIGDHYDEYLQADQPGARTICGHLDADDGRFSGTGGHPPFYPWGALDAKVLDSEMARSMHFEGRWGRACGEAFHSAEFVDRHPQYDWLGDYLVDRPAQDWQKLTIDRDSAAEA